MPCIIADSCKIMLKDINYPYEISNVIMDTNKSFIKTLPCADALHQAKWLYMAHIRQPVRRPAPLQIALRYQFT